MTIKGKLYKTEGSFELSLYLDKQGIMDLQLALARACNTWDQGPKDIQELDNKLRDILGMEGFKDAQPVQP